MNRNGRPSPEGSAKEDISLYPGQPPVLSSKNLDKWSPGSSKRAELRDSQSPPCTPPFMTYAQPGYHASFPEQYSNGRQSTSSDGSYHQMHPPLRTASFEYTSSPTFSHSSPPVPHGMPMSADLFAFHGDGALFPSEPQNPQPSLNGQWLSLMQDSNSLDFASHSHSSHSHPSHPH